MNERDLDLRFPDIPAFDESCAKQVLEHLQGQARPPGALARLEQLAAQLAGIQASNHPTADRITAYIFAADHGMARSGVSAYPPSVTAAMVPVLLSGRASANALAKSSQVRLVIVDAGVDADLPLHDNLISVKVGRGTGNAIEAPAMTAEQARTALSAGLRIAISSVSEHDDVLILGEMGIGNTAAAALMIHRLAPGPLANCIGPGAGHTAEGLARKQRLLSCAAARSSATDPFSVLCEFGGFEIAMMAGAAIGAASRRGVVLIDGVISAAAALLAVRLCPAVAPFLVYGHRSVEPAFGIALQSLGASPLLDLEMRLGEGSGAILAAPLLRAACLLHDRVASLTEVLESL